MRQFIAADMPDARGCVRVTGRDARYLVQVLRLAPGGILDVRVPSGELVCMRCAAVQKGAAVLQLETAPTESLSGDAAASSVRSGVSAAEIDGGAAAGGELWLFQCLPKAQKMDLVVRQATELGVARIVPVVSRHSVFAAVGGAPADFRAERWERIIKEARQQSGSPVATEITAPLDAAGAIRLWKAETRQFAASAAAFLFTENPLATNSVYGYLTYKPVLSAAAVGPEGGFAAEEEAAFRSAGFLPLHLKTNVLRTETAALYALAVLQNAVTEFDSWKRKE